MDRTISRALREKGSEAPTENDCWPENAEIEEGLDTPEKSRVVAASTSLHPSPQVIPERRCQGVGGRPRQNHRDPHRQHDRHQRQGGHVHLQLGGVFGPPSLPAPRQRAHVHQDHQQEQCHHENDERHPHRPQIGRVDRQRDPGRQGRQRGRSAGAGFPQAAK